MRKKIQSVKIKTPYVCSKEQLANIFTKALDTLNLQRIICKLESIDVYDPNLREIVGDK